MNPIAATSELLRTLRLQRQRKGLSQAQLGERLHTPQSHLARIERGVTDVRLSTLTEIARALDLELMLVPKHLVPAIRYTIDAQQKPSTDAPKLVGNYPEEETAKQHEL